AHAARREAQRHPALLGLQPKTLCVQVRQEAPALLVVGVRDSVTDTGLLAGDLADARHTNNLEISVTYAREDASRPIPGRALYQPGGAITSRRRPGATTMSGLVWHGIGEGRNLGKRPRRDVALGCGQIPTTTLSWGECHAFNWMSRRLRGAACTCCLDHIRVGGRSRLERWTCRQFCVHPYG